ncbi:MAG: pollen Ole e 1 allergen/extensin family protein [Bacteroidaceae bacterium]|nr:pollen Ole e 1 allergen/extensin family protein [Bacteroidaceae bacterium]
MKRLVLLPILFSVCTTLVAQTAEDDAARLVTYAARINYFGRLCPQEKVYLHLDNTAYFQGETIWYAANVVDVTTGREAASKVLYVELLSPTGVVLKQQKLKVVDGRCHGSFSLIDTSVEEAVALRGAVGYPSGYYQIRAYTRTMLNFDDAGVFSRVIPVYKAPEEEGDYADPVMRKYSYKELNRPEPERSETPKELNLSFYPEGGHLISGLPCRVAFKATDKQGHGVDIEALTDNNGNPLSIPLQHNGMGSFEITPSEKAQKLQAVYEGKKYTFTLPEPEPEGCTLCLTRAEGEDSLSVSFAAAGSPSTKLLGYTLTSQGHCNWVDTLTIGTRGCTRSIATAGFPTGVHQLTLFDADGAVYAQRLLFIDNGIPTEAVSVTAEKADIHPFDEIRLNLQVEASPQPSPKGKGAVSGGNQVTPPLGGDGGGYTFSLAVRDAADYGTAYRDDIRTYMLLSSELKGLIEEPGWYFDASPQPSPEGKGAASGGNQFTPPSGGEGEATPFGGRLQALDLLMMVQGWTRYNWRQMAGVEPFKIRHYTEKQLVVDGWAFSRIKETPLPGVKMAVRLTSLDRKHRQNATVTTDSLGYWSVGVEDFEGEWDLYMETRQKGDKKGDKTTRVRLERASKPALYAYTPLETWLPEYTWDAAGMLTVEKAGDSEYQLPSDSHLLDEVEVKGKRKYIDYNTFKAFDAAKDAELMIDEGNYTYKVVDYLRDKGYDVTFPVGETFESFISRYTHEDWLSCPPLEEINGPDSMVSRTIYYQWISIQSLINGVRTFWFIKDGKRDRTGPSFFDGFDLDLEEVKSILVYDDRNLFSSFPAIRDLFTNRLIRKFERPHNYLGLPAGLYIVEIELNPSHKRRTYVDKNARSTSFSGYTPVVEFYAPTYPNGPIQGDKDYRRTIYWNPAVTTDADGHASVSFYNNGYSRALTISAEGLTSDGVPIVN